MGNTVFTFILIFLSGPLAFSQEYLISNARIGFPVPLYGDMCSARDPMGNARFLNVDGSGNLVISGTIVASNPSVGPNGAATPTSSTLVGATNGTTLQPLKVDGSGNLEVSGTVTASNPSVSTTGTAVPASATYFGANKAGALTGLLLDGSSNLFTVLGAPIPAGTNSIGGVTQSGTWTTGRTWTLLNTTDSVNVGNFPATVAVTQSTTPWVVSGTITASNPSVGTNGAVAPTSSTQIGGFDGTDLRALSVNSSGVLANPIGAATAANQTTIITTLGSPFQAGGSIGNTSFAVTQPTAANLNATVVQPTGSNLHVDVDSAPTTVVNQGTSPWVVSGTSTITGTVTSNQGTTPWVDNVSQFGGNNVVTGTGVSGLGIPRVTVASDSSTVVTQPTATNLNATVVQPTATNLNATVVQPTGTNLHTVVDSGSITATQATAANLNATVAQPTAANLNATVVQPTGTNLHTVVDSGTITTTPGTPTALTVSNAAVTIGTSAVRLTHNGSAPASTRVLLVAELIGTSTANCYFGASTVTNSGATRGVQMFAGQAFSFNNDAGDYFAVCDTAAQTFLIVEQE